MLGILIISLIFVCAQVYGEMTVQLSTNETLHFPVTLFMSGLSWSRSLETQLSNSSIIVQTYSVEFDNMLCNEQVLIEASRPPAGSHNPVLLIDYPPSCWPEDVAVIASKYGYAALVVGSPAQVPGMLSVMYWKHRQVRTIPILEISGSAIYPHNLSYEKILAASLKPSPNYFQTAEFVGITEAMNAILILLNIYSAWLCYNRLLANWAGWKNINLAVAICVLESVSIIWRVAFSVDPYGVLHIISFPATIVIMFFSLFPGMISTYLISLRLYLIIRQYAAAHLSNKTKNIVVVSSILLLCWFLGFELWAMQGISTLTGKGEIIILRVGDGMLLQVACMFFFARVKVVLIHRMRE
jgi:hypothetical protein